MPRPTAAQFSYGSVTVVFSALAMLLLARTESGIGVAVVCIAALALGLLVAVTVPLPGRAGQARQATTRSPARTQHVIEDIETPAARRNRVGEHSLHR
ncbi:hypothetical protein [Streptomyces sp. B1I3]|uniref:hypothetical protein n=1 Tax=Streptomyces sp. B1I3 TaxID=3042264 RepID=UPI002782366E|nr:hypothetical protein [Streptomyces sp. B1I3]MDQ0796126.1 hypothetical protein [Streptomyces sp. B1I3]